MTKPTIFALIPARGGSKGIPKKNLRNLNDAPLIAYNIDAARRSIVDEVYVSTDCKEIAHTAVEYGAKVVMRPSNLAQDTSSSEDVLIHFANLLEFDILVFLQCTSPLTNPDDINSAIKLMESYDSIVSVCKDHGGWLCGGFRWTEYLSQAIPVDYDLLSPRPRRQDMKTYYRENGAIYVTTKEGLLKSKNRLNGRVGLYEMPRQRSFEIDELEDLEEIQLWFKM